MSTRTMCTVAALSAAITVLLAVPARADAWGSRALIEGMSGDDVTELQIRVAGWYDNCAGVPCHDHFALDGAFGPKTRRAVRNFQKAYSVAVTGAMDSPTYAKLESLEESDGSTPHFTFAEFAEKSGECRTGNTGTFKGGRVGEAAVVQYVRKLMWRLETLRHKMADQYKVVVWSGFRSTAYQDCLRNKHGRKVARDSQHSYGTAYDGVMPGINQGRMRGLAKTSEFHGIMCYGSGDSHNHLDIRLDNATSNGGGQFVWPSQDGQGRDRTLGGDTCYGGHTSAPSTGVQSPAEGSALLDPWGVAPDPGGPSEAEAATKAAASEETWMFSDVETVGDLGGICQCTARIA